MAAAAYKPIYISGYKEDEDDLVALVGQSELSMVEEINFDYG